ncbi:toprim domain-containing protein [Rhodoblastus sp.]|uniref:toprim domain-containing protein n=1 Tax=Rhodoblastus sp. TaxID=1962975 RepID=UPI0025E773F1|nr:toprim domain-containing protein [Rhodoblastus sp.]
MGAVQNRRAAPLDFDCLAQRIVPATPAMRDEFHASDEGVEDVDPRPFVAARDAHEDDARRYWKSQIREALHGRIVELVSHLLAKKPNGNARNGKRRWGNHHSFEMNVSGPFCGRWRDFETDERGDVFDLIRRQLGLNFRDALDWAAHWCGISRIAPTSAEIAGWKTAEAERVERERRDTFEQAKKEAATIAFVQRIWRDTIAIDGTLGDKYFFDCRKIQAPEYPASLRWSIKERAIIGAITNEAGEIVGVQQIAVTPSGTKDTDRWPEHGSAKKTLGFAGKGVLRFPGPDDEPICFAEGPETGLSVWAATGFETHVLVGSLSSVIGRICDPNGNPLPCYQRRRIILCQDDDAPGAPALRAAKDALAKLTKLGFDAAIATPFNPRRHDKSDFNDLLREQGLDAVRQRIEAAVVGYETRHVDFLTLEEGQERLGEHMEGFFAQVHRSHYRNTAPPALPLAIAAPVGLGKTHAALAEALRTLIAMREKVNDRVKSAKVIVFAVPSIDLADEVAARFNQMACAAGTRLKAAVWRGAAAINPDGDGESTMCCDLETMQEALRLEAEVGKEVCDRECPHVFGCAYCLQKEEEADLWVISHPAIFHNAPRPIRNAKVAALIIDESPWQAGLVGLGDDKIELLLNDRDGRFGFKVRWLHVGEDRLVIARKKLFDALKAHPLGFVGRAALLSAGLTADECKNSIQDEQFRKMREENWRTREINASIRPMMALWRAVADLLGDNGPDRCGRLFVFENENGQKVLRVTGCLSVAADYRAPTLLIDATMDVELLRPFWSDIEEAPPFLIDAPHQKIIQATNKTYAKTSLLRDQDGDGRPNEKARALRLQKLRSVILRERRNVLGETLVVGNKQVIDELKLPQRLVHAAWFNAVAGRDHWKNVGLVIVVGRPMPSPRAVEKLARALTGRVPEAAEDWYPRRDVERLKRNGRETIVVVGEGFSHPDEYCERVRQRIVNGEIVQAIGRGRGIRRDAARPLKILVLGDTPLPFPVDEFASAEINNASATDRMLAEGGVAFENGTSASKAYPELWPMVGAAKTALQRQGHLVLAEKCVRFQCAGKGRHVERAWYDARVVEDPRAAIESLLGPLVFFEFTDDAETGDGTEPASQPRLSPDAKRYLSLLEQLSLTAGRRVLHPGSNTEVTAVGRDALRANFYADKIGDAETVRKAFRRAEVRMLELRLIEIFGVGEDETVGLLPGQNV